MPVKDWQADEDRYVNELKDFLKKNGYTSKNAGVVISFPMADSSASYMVMSMKPVQLMHLRVGDEWEFQYAHLMTAKEIQEKIDHRKSMEDFWKKQADKKKNK